jgi:hypothetical protein
MDAFCYASGLIDFARTTPDGALPIARGPARALRDFIEPLARHGYSTRKVRGRPTKIPGTEHLLVPGVPEAINQSGALVALRRWLRWIDDHAPAGVAVEVPANRLTCDECPSPIDEVRDVESFITDPIGRVERVLCAR